MDVLNEIINPVFKIGEMFELQSQTALLIVLGSLFILLASFRMVNRVTRLNQQHQHTITMLKRDMHALTTAAVNVGKRVHELERNQQQSVQQKHVHIFQTEKKPLQKSQLAKTQLQQAPGHVDKAHAFPDIYEPANQPYEHAIRMAQRGARTEELMATCGLSSSEAELIAMLHRLDKTA